MMEQAGLMERLFSSFQMMLARVSGEVVDTNQEIVDDPSKINQDPENSAWFFKLKIKDKSEMDSLMNKDDYDKFAKETTT